MHHLQSSARFVSVRYLSAACLAGSVGVAGCSYDVEGWVARELAQSRSCGTFGSQRCPERPPALPLGFADLNESRRGRELAPGVNYTRIERGSLSGDGFKVDVAFTNDPALAEALVSGLAERGFESFAEVLAERAPDDELAGPLGYLVRSQAFGSVEDANAWRDEVAAAGYSGLRVVYGGEDGGLTSGPWVVHVLEVEPSVFMGTVAPALATSTIPERETLSAMAARLGSIAAINGGYFVIGSVDGTPGDLAGISLLGGELASEAVDGRTSLILLPQGEPARVAAVSDSSIVSSSEGASRLVDGFNRTPGLVRACGGSGGDVPTELPKHDFTCSDASELIVFTRHFGDARLPRVGAEAVLDADGVVTALRQQASGDPVPSAGSVLLGTGDAADWLLAHATVGTTLRVQSEVAAEGTTLSSAAGIVNGGPRLLRAGELDIRAAAEGFVWADNPEFYYRFGVRRNPRTLAGVTEEGALLLVAVDGRAPGYSVGASFEESALLLQALGAADGLNLDGGGSTSLSVGAELQTRPSDATGERPIGDAILIVP